MEDILTQMKPFIIRKNTKNKGKPSETKQIAAKKSCPMHHICVALSTPKESKM